MDELALPKGKKIILFDGVCNFCDTTIQKIIRWDTKKQFVFASLQSEIGQKILKYIGVDTSTDSIVMYEPGVAYHIKSQAILEIMSTVHPLGAVFSLLKILPNSISDWCYDYFAKNRYKWYGKKEACMIPTPEVKERFLEFFPKSL